MNADKRRWNNFLALRVEISMPVLWNDIRYGLRMLAANPGFTAVAIVSLAVGNGGNNSEVTLADSLLLRVVPGARPALGGRVVSTSPPGPFGDIYDRDYVEY